MSVAQSGIEVSYFDRSKVGQVGSLRRVSVEATPDAFLKLVRTHVVVDALPRTSTELGDVTVQPDGVRRDVALRCELDSTLVEGQTLRLVERDDGASKGVDVALRPFEGPHPVFGAFDVSRVAQHRIRETNAILDVVFGARIDAVPPRRTSALVRAQRVQKDLL